MYYQCDVNFAKEVVVNYFKTEPATIIAEYGDQISLMFVQASGCGAKYQGWNESLWGHQGEAKIVWRYGAGTMSCAVKPQ